MRFLRTQNGVSVRLACGVALALGLLAVRPVDARNLVDMQGTRVKLSDRPTRIVALAPALGELVARLLGNDLSRLVGVSDFTDSSEALKRVPSIGSYARFNVEKVMSLRPDLVLATSAGNAKDQVLRLRELGLPVVVVSADNLKELIQSIRLVGDAVGARREGRKIAEELANHIAEAKKRARARKPRKVLLQIGDDPLVVAGGGSFIHEAIEAVGAVNLYGDADGYPRPSLEDVLKRNPEVVLVVTMTEDKEVFEKMARKWSTFTALKAVKSDQVKVLNGDTLLRPSIRFTEGLLLLEHAIYGEK